MILFADTAYWIALTDIRDSLHARALALSEELGDDLVLTTDDVLVEYLTFFSATGAGLRTEAGQFVRDLLEAPNVRVIPQSRQSFLSGLDLYLSRPDKGYSLTDCISMQTMRREGLAEALTNDRHFEQEGFRALFRS